VDQTEAAAPSPVTERICPSDLLGRAYTNGLSAFRVVELDRANPLTHVIVEHISTGVYCPMSALMVRKSMESCNRRNVAARSI
jgi:hypothetical protein